MTKALRLRGAFLLFAGDGDVKSGGREENRKTYEEGRSRRTEWGAIKKGIRRRMGKKQQPQKRNPNNVRRQDKSDCGKDGQEERRQAGRTLGPAGSVRACGQLKVCA